MSRERIDERGWQITSNWLQDSVTKNQGFEVCHDGYYAMTVEVAATFVDAFKASLHLLNTCYETGMSDPAAEIAKLRQEVADLKAGQQEVATDSLKLGMATGDYVADLNQQIETLTKEQGELRLVREHNLGLGRALNQKIDMIATLRAQVAAGEKLAKAGRKLVDWLQMLARNAEVKATTERFATLRKAYQYDKKNYRATAVDMESALRIWQAVKEGNHED